MKSKEISQIVLVGIIATAIIVLAIIGNSIPKTSTGIANSCEICEVKHNETALGIVYNYESGEGLCICNMNITEPFFTLNEV